jgi:hypothetical protein
MNMPPLHRNFSYRQVLGELIYAYVVCRLDIGYAITFLSHFATVLAEEHYKALKDIAKYLRRTIDWGIIYWHAKPLASLPYVSQTRRSVTSEGDGQSVSPCLHHSKVSFAIRSEALAAR